jgi:hypothetical protein
VHRPPPYLYRDSLNGLLPLRHIVWMLPVTRAEGQAANRNRHGDCPRAIRLHLGDQSRAHATSTGVTSLGAVDRSSRKVRSTGPQPPLLQSRSGGSRRHQSCRGEGGTTAGEILKSIMWPIIRSTPDARPGTAPDEKTEMRYPNPRIRACSPTSLGPAFSSARSIGAKTSR